MSGVTTGDTEGGGLAHRLRHGAGGNQRLGRHAAGVETIAAHRAGFDQHRPAPELGRACGHAQPGRTGPDDADIGLEGFHRVRPASRGRPRNARHTTGKIDSTASPISGQNTAGLKMRPRSGEPPASKIAPSPLPSPA